MSPKPKLIRPTPEEEAEIQAGIDQDADNPEWTDEDFERATRPGLPRPPTSAEVLAAPKAHRKVEKDN